MSKHTPAPWIVVESDNAPVARPAAWICTIGNNQADPAVFSTAMDGDKFIFGDKLADARLIAAAPDMLATLIMLRDADDVAVTEGYSCGMGAEQRAAVNAAIAKAEGRS